MVIDKTKGINYLLHSVVDLALSNIQYSPLKKQSENSTTATTHKRKHPQTSSKPSPILKLFGIETTNFIHVISQFPVSRFYPISSPAHSHSHSPPVLPSAYTVQLFITMQAP